MWRDYSYGKGRIALGITGYNRSGSVTESISSMKHAAHMLSHLITLPQQEKMIEDTIFFILPEHRLVTVNN